MHAIIEPGAGWSRLLGGPRDATRSVGSWSDFSPARMGYRVGQRSITYGPGTVTPADVTLPIEPHPDIATYQAPSVLSTSVLSTIDWPNILAGAAVGIVGALILRRLL